VPDVDLTLDLICQGLRVGLFAAPDCAAFWAQEYAALPSGPLSCPTE
jgi:hypothetical protein